jgi:neutral trehalase
MTNYGRVSLKVEDSEVRAAYKALFDELASNLRRPSGIVKGVYAVPGGKYQLSWLWDTAFISQIWLLMNPKVAQEIVLTHISSQLENGMIPHMFGPHYVSSITQPPLLAWAAWRIYQKIKNKKFLERVYPHLNRFNEYFYLERDFNKNELFSWVHPHESGWDNSPRWDEVDVKSLDALDLNCYLIVQMRALSRMAEVLNERSEKEKFEGRTDKLILRIREEHWDSRDEFFYDLSPGGFIGVKTPAALLTLFAEVATKPQAKALVEHLTDPDEFWTSFPTPTVASNEPKFSLDYWRGPVWVNINYMIYLGLKSYGYDEVANKLKEKTILMVAKTYSKRKNFYEFYNPFSGDVDGLETHKPTNHFVGWTGLIANLIEETLENSRPKA